MSTEPIRVLFAADISRRPDTGLGRHQHFLAQELRRLGFEVTQFQAEDVAGSPAAKLRRFRFPWAVMREALRQQREGRGYHAVVVHEGSGAGACLARQLGWLRAACVVVSHNPEQKVWELNLALARRGLHAIPRSSRLLWPLTRLVQSNFALRAADWVLCLSEEDRAFLAERTAQPAARIVRISNGVEPRFFGAPPVCSEPRILWVASWLPHKGMREFRQALPQVLEAFPSASASLLGTGCDPAVSLSEFPASLRARITASARISPEDLPVACAAHNIFVLPSWYEGMPLSLLEAMASGLAVVAAAVGGIRDVVRSGVDGLLVAPQDAAALEVALARLCGNAAERARLGAAAQQRAQEFTWERAGLLLAEVLQQAVASGVSEPAVAGRAAWSEPLSK